MKIRVTDVFTGADVDLTASFTTEHSASSYGQAVMFIDEWGALMDYMSWVAGAGRVIEATDEEREQFEKWHSLIDLMGGRL